MNTCDVLIVGAGVTGLTLANLLAERSEGHIVLVDSQQAPAGEREDTRALAISVGAECVLSACGVWEMLDKRRIGRIERMQVWEQAGSEIVFDAAEIAQTKLASVLRTAQLESALREKALAQANIRWESPARLQSVNNDPKGVQLVLDNGAQYQTGCLVGADGANSSVRDFAGITWTSKDYEQSALFGIARADVAHGHVARQVFLDSGPLALLPLAEEGCSAMIWSLPPDQAEQLRALSPAAFAAHLSAADPRLPGPFREVTGLAVAPLRRGDACAYVSDRITLIGDAAHRVHPMAGQGANLGILDAAALVDCLLDKDKHLKTTASGLRRYQRWRRSENQHMIEAIDKLHWLFHRPTGIVSSVRALGLSTTNRLAPLKAALMRRASALAGDLPSAARRDRTL